MNWKKNRDINSTPTLLFSANRSWNLVNFRRTLLKELSTHFRIVAVAPPDETTVQLRQLVDNYYPIKIDAHSTNPVKEIEILKSYYQIYRRVKPKLIFHYTIKPNIYGNLAAKLLKIRSVSVITGLGYTFINNNWIAQTARFLYKIALSHPERVLFLNREDWEQFLQLGLINSQKGELLPGEGIDLNYFPPAEQFLKKREWVLSENIAPTKELSIVKKKGQSLTPSSKHSSKHFFRLLFIGRLLKEKGIYQLVEGVRIFNQFYKHRIEKNSNFQLKVQLVGEIVFNSPSAIKIEEILEWEREGLVKYLGKKADIRPYIASSDCIVLPSYREGIPRAILEGMAMEKPVIVTDVPGCRGVVENGVTGFIVPPNSPEKLAEAIYRMIVLPVEERKKMGKKGRLKVAEEFSDQIVIKKYLKLIKELLGIEVGARVVKK